MLELSTQPRLLSSNRRSSNGEERENQLRSSAAKSTIPFCTMNIEQDDFEISPNYDDEERSVPNGNCDPTAPPVIATTPALHAFPACPAIAAAIDYNEGTSFEDDSPNSKKRHHPNRNNSRLKLSKNSNLNQSRQSQSGDNQPDSPSGRVGIAGQIAAVGSNTASTNLNIGGGGNANANANNANNDNINNANNNGIPPSEKRELKSALQNIKLKQKLGNFINKTQGRRYQLLEKVNFKMLNDLAVISNDNKLHRGGVLSSSARQLVDNQQSSTISLIEHLAIMFPPFNPSSRFKLWWDILQMLITIAVLFYLPIHLVFQIDLHQLVPTYVLQTCLPLSIALDILVSLNTARFLKGVLSTDRKLILQSYLQTTFKYDAIACGPLLMYIFTSTEISSDNNYQLLRFTILSVFYKVVQFGHVFKQVEDVFPLSTYTSNVIQLIKLLFNILLNLHISALVWLFVAFVQIKGGKTNTWMHAASIDAEDWQTQYVYSYYFSTVTMITVGYGDISPRSVVEKLVSVLNMMIACGQFAYSVNMIGNIFAQFFKLSNEIKANMYVINNYMSTKNISKDLQYQIREYLDYYWKQEKSSNTDMEAKILEQLSQKLRDTLLMEANKIALRDSPIFNMNFSDQIVLKTLPLIEELRCTPEEIIYLKGDNDDSSIFFIEKGCVEAFTYQRTPFNKKMRTINPLYTMGPGQFFGSFNFFTGQSREINMRSNEFTTLLKVKRADFLALLKDYPDDYEVYCMIRDRAIYSSELHQIGSKCQCCDKSDHLLPLCPLIHYVPQKFVVIRQFAQGQNNRRQQFQRDSTKQFHTLKTRKLAEKRLEEYTVDNSEEIRAYFRKFFIDIARDHSDTSFSSDFDDDDDDDDDEEEEEDNNSNQGIEYSSDDAQHENLSVKSKRSSTTEKRIYSQKFESAIRINNTNSNNSISYQISSNNNNNSNPIIQQLQPHSNQKSQFAASEQIDILRVPSHEDSIEQEGSVFVHPSFVKEKLFYLNNNNNNNNKLKPAKNNHHYHHNNIPPVSISSAAELIPSEFNWQNKPERNPSAVSSQLVHSIQYLQEGEENISNPSLNSIGKHTNNPNQIRVKSKNSIRATRQSRSANPNKKKSLDRLSYLQQQQHQQPGRKSLFETEAKIQQNHQNENLQQILDSFFSNFSKKKSPKGIHKIKQALKQAQKYTPNNNNNAGGVNGATVAEATGAARDMEQFNPFYHNNNMDIQEIIRRLFQNPHQNHQKYDLNNIGRILMQKINIINSINSSGFRRDAQAFDISNQNGGINMRNNSIAAAAAGANALNATTNAGNGMQLMGGFDQNDAAMKQELKEQLLKLLQEQQLMQLLPNYTGESAFLPQQNMNMNSQVPKDQLDDAMHIYKFFFPQYNITNIIENLANKKRMKKEVEKKTLENKIIEGLKDNKNIRQRIRVPVVAQKSRASSSRASNASAIPRLPTQLGTKVGLQTSAFHSTTTMLRNLKKSSGGAAVSEESLRTSNSSISSNNNNNNNNNGNPTKKDDSRKSSTNQRSSHIESSISQGNPPINSENDKRELKHRKSSQVQVQGISDIMRFGVETEEIQESCDATGRIGHLYRVQDINNSLSSSQFPLEKRPREKSQEQHKEFEEENNEESQRRLEIRTIEDKSQAAFLRTASIASSSSKRFHHRHAEELNDLTDRLNFKGENTKFNSKDQGILKVYQVDVSFE